MIQFGHEMTNPDLFIRLYSVPDDAIETNEKAFAATAGLPYYISCDALKLYDGLTTEPQFTWYKDGDVITESSNVSISVNQTSYYIVTSTVSTDYVTTSLADNYTCEVSLSSPGRKSPLTSQSTITVSAYSK